MYNAQKRKLAEIGANSSATSGSVNSGSGDIAQLGTMDHLLSGVEAGAYMVLITNPLWLLKTRMQTQTGTETVMSHKGGSGVESGDVPRRYQGPLGRGDGFSFHFIRLQYIELQW